MSRPKPPKMKKLRCALCRKRIYVPKNGPVSSTGTYTSKKNRPLCLSCRNAGTDGGFCL